MVSYRIQILAVAIVSALLMGALANQAANAKPSALAPLSKTPSSGIGLAANLNRTGGGTLANPTYYDRALKSSLWVRTPGGLVFHSCSYNVPNGSKVDSVHGKITFPGGRIVSLTRCAYPRLVHPAAHPAIRPAGLQAEPLGTHGWMQGFQQDGLPPLGNLYVRYAVPSAPSSGTETDSAWSALANDPNGDVLIQPAVAWGFVSTAKNGVPIPNDSGQYLEMAAYYYWTGNAVAASFVQVKALDTLEAFASATGCDSGGGGCSWLISIYDDNSKAISQFTVGSASAFTTLIGGMFESRSAVNCTQLFANHHLVFRNIIVGTVSGALVDPTFHKRVVDQECSMNTTYTDTSGDITWTP